VVVEVIDKGPSRGAIVVSRRDLYEKASDVLLARITQSTFCRADGGFGGPVTASPKPEELPDRACDLAFDLPTSAQMALLYRLNGDYNRLHADPSVAQEAGFVRPILHGLASFGLAGWSIIAGLAGGQAERLHALNCRFTAPVYPGETLRADLWQDGETVHFRLVDKERDVVVVNNGYARLSVQ
jgi:acyl dehydratase